MKVDAAHIEYFRWTTAVSAMTSTAGSICMRQPTPLRTCWLVRRAELAAIFIGQPFGKRESPTVHHSTNSIALNQWVRIEWHAHYDATVANRFEVKLFNSPDSSTAHRDQDASWTARGSTNTTTWFGVCNAVAWGSDFWIDNCVIRDDAYPGPYDPAEAIADPVTYKVRCFYGNYSSTGTFDEYQSWFQPQSRRMAGTLAGTASISQGRSRTRTSSTPTGRPTSASSAMTPTSPPCPSRPRWVATTERLPIT